MKPFFQLCKFEFTSKPVVMGLSVMPVIYAWFVLKFMRQDYRFSVDLPSYGIILMVIFFLGAAWIFANGDYGWRKDAITLQQRSTQEFLFSRAISKNTQFFAKASLYLVFCCAPLVFMWGYSYTMPLIRVELPRNAAQPPNSTVEFYIRNFSDVRIEKNSSGKKNETQYAVIPQGQVSYAKYALFTGVLLCLLYEFLVFVFWKYRGAIPVLYFAFLMMSTGSLGIGLEPGVSSKDEAWAWVSNHPVVAFLMLGLFAVLTQWYCCKKFVNAEVRS